MQITAFCLRFLTCLKLFPVFFRLKLGLGCHYFKQSALKKHLCETCLPQFPLCLVKNSGETSICYNVLSLHCAIIEHWFSAWTLGEETASLSLSNQVIVWNFQTWQGFTIHHFMKYHSHYMIINSPRHISDKIAGIF